MSGVARFAVRLANGLAARGRRAGLLLHAATAAIPPLRLPLDDRVEVFDCGDLPPIEDADPELFVERYALASDRLAAGGPVAVVLGQHAGPFAVAAELIGSRSHDFRTVGVAHSDNGYDTRVLAHYEPLLHALVAVSGSLRSSIASLAPRRAESIELIPYGVEVPATSHSREPTGGRPLRLLYAGRLDHYQKRVLALPGLSRELDRRGIAHRLTIVGDGPARDDLARECEGTASISFAPAATPAQVASLLDANDAFVLPSRFEGLSIAMLEALAHGCVPVVAPSRSGTAEAVLPGVTGEIASATPDCDERTTGLALADAVDALRRRDLGEMAERCRRHAQQHFSIETHTDRWCALLDRVAREPPRTWPIGRPARFDAASASGSGSVPADAAERFLRVAESLGGAAIALHGAGAHTRALEGSIGRINLVCIADDDRQRHGETLLGVPVVDPNHVGSTGVQHVVVSTHLHEPAVWRRRAIYERQGLTVHRLYADTDAR
ncbi:MAG: glycosyltransferase family 4 protein [Planctomycetota bacterium]